MYCLMYWKSKDARSMYLFTLIEDNNPRFLFNTEQKLTKHRSTSFICSSDDLMNFFNDNIEIIRQKMETKFKDNQFDN